MWWDEYEYHDVTEDGVPFDRVLLFVGANEDHTGYLYLAAFDNNSDEAVAACRETLKKNDTFKFGIDASLTFPYLHWWGDNHPDGDTRYRVGYKYENIAGGSNVHNFSGGVSYYIRPSRLVTHVFTPFSLSVVRMQVGANVNDKTDFAELVRMLAGNEFVPAVGYEFTYNDYRSTRPGPTPMAPAISTVSTITRVSSTPATSSSKQTLNCVSPCMEDLWRRFPRCGERLGIV